MEFPPLLSLARSSSWDELSKRIASLVGSPSFEREILMSDDEMGDTVSHFVATSAPSSTCRDLFLSSPTAIMTRNRSQLTPLGSALLAGREDIVRFLLTEAGAAKSIFVEGYAANSLVCSLPSAYSSSTFVTESFGHEVAPHLLKLVDDHLSLHIRRLDIARRNVEIPNSNVLESNGIPISGQNNTSSSSSSSSSGTAAAGGKSSPTSSSLTAAAFKPTPPRLFLGDIVEAGPDGSASNTNIPIEDGVRGIVVGVTPRATTPQYIMGPGGPQMMPTNTAAAATSGPMTISVMWCSSVASSRGISQYNYDSTAHSYPLQLVQRPSILDSVVLKNGGERLRAGQFVCLRDDSSSSPSGCLGRPVHRRIGVVIYDDSGAKSTSSNSNGGRRGGYAGRYTGGGGGHVFNAIRDAKDKRHNRFLVCRLPATGNVSNECSLYSSEDLRALSITDPSVQAVIQPQSSSIAGAAVPPAAGAGAGAAPTALPLATPATPAVRPSEPAKGVRVKRGPSWIPDIYKDQDGGKGNLGTVVGPADRLCNWWRVRWDVNGSEYNYRWIPDEGGACDMSLATEAEEKEYDAMKQRNGAAVKSAGTNARDAGEDAADDNAADDSQQEQGGGGGEGDSEYDTINDTHARTATATRNNDALPEARETPCHPRNLAQGDIVRRGVDWDRGVDDGKDGGDFGFVLSVASEAASKSKFRPVKVMWLTSGKVGLYQYTFATGGKFVIEKVTNNDFDLNGNLRDAPDALKALLKSRSITTTATTDATKGAGSVPMSSKATPSQLSFPLSLRIVPGDFVQLARGWSSSTSSSGVVGCLAKKSATESSSSSSRMIGVVVAEVDNALGDDVIPGDRQFLIQAISQAESSSSTSTTPAKQGGTDKVGVVKAKSVRKRKGTEKVAPVATSSSSSSSSSSTSSPETVKLTASIYPESALQLVSSYRLEISRPRTRKFAAGKGIHAGVKVRLSRKCQDLSGCLIGPALRLVGEVRAVSRNGVEVIHQGASWYYAIHYLVRLEANDNGEDSGTGNDSEDDDDDDDGSDDNSDGDENRTGISSSHKGFSSRQNNQGGFGNKGLNYISSSAAQQDEAAMLAEAMRLSAATSNGNNRCKELPNVAAGDFSVGDLVVLNPSFSGLSSLPPAEGIGKIPGENVGRVIQCDDPSSKAPLRVIAIHGPMATKSAFTNYPSEAVLPAPKAKVSEVNNLAASANAAATGSTTSSSSSDASMMVSLGSLVVLSADCTITDGSLGLTSAKSVGVVIFVDWSEEESFKVFNPENSMYSYYRFDHLIHAPVGEIPGEDSSSRTSSSDDLPSTGTSEPKTPVFAPGDTVVLAANLKEKSAPVGAGSGANNSTSSSRHRCIDAIGRIGRVTRVISSSENNSSGGGGGVEYEVVHINAPITLATFTSSGHLGAASSAVLSNYHNSIISTYSGHELSLSTGPVLTSKGRLLASGDTVCLSRFTLQRMDNQRCLGHRVHGRTGVIVSIHSDVNSSCPVVVRAIATGNGGKTSNYDFHELQLLEEGRDEIAAMNAVFSAVTDGVNGGNNASPSSSSPSFVSFLRRSGPTGAFTGPGAIGGLSASASLHDSGASSSATTSFASSPFPPPPPPSGPSVVRVDSTWFAEQREFQGIISILDLMARKDRHGNGPLHHAAYAGLSATYKALIVGGGRAFEPSHEPGWTPASILDGVLTRKAALLHRYLTMRGIMSSYPAAMRAACIALAAMTGEEESAGPKVLAASQARGLVLVPPPANGGTPPSLAVLDEKDAGILALKEGEYEMSANCLAAAEANRCVEAYPYAALVYMLRSAQHAAMSRELLDMYFNSFANPEYSFTFDPVALYALYCLLFEGASRANATRWGRLRAADALRAFKCFEDSAAEWLKASDNIDLLEPDTGINGEGISGGGTEPGDNEEPVDEETAAEIADERASEDDPFSPEAQWEKARNNAGVPSASMDKLMRMIGLNTVKMQALNVYKSILVRNTAAGLRHGANVDTTTNTSMIFTGNPGTGKTTVAELVAGMMKETGFRTGPFVSLTGTKALQNGMDEWKDMLGKITKGVLFLDEAYQLHPKKGGGQTAQQMIDLLMEFVERHRGTCTVILAGYEDEVRDLLGVNPGLPSRFPTTFHFSDYNEIQLRAIFRQIVKEKGYILPSRTECGVSLAKIVAARLSRRIGIKGFGNARDTRNKVDEAIKRWTERKGTELLRLQETGGAISSRSFFRLTREDVLGRKPSFENSPLLAELDKLVGQQTIKTLIRTTMQKVLADFDSEEQGKKVSGMILHAIFVGNPGVGKTTIAKLYGALLKEWGMLSKGDLIVKTPKDFASGGVVGDAEGKVLEVLNSAKGCVLLIDEAYNLDPAQGTAGMKGALDTLLEKMPIGENADMAIILAGYKEPMAALMRNNNEGITSRFQSTPWVFEDYTDAELLQIMIHMVVKADVACPDSVARKAVEQISLQRKKPGFGNARAIEDMLSMGKAAFQARLYRARQAYQVALQSGKGGPFPVIPPSVLTIDDLVREQTTVDKARAAFNSMIGVPCVVDFVNEMIGLADSVTEEGGDPSSIAGELHMSFYGPPGTGKSAAARQFGKLLYNLRVLATPEVTEVRASELQAAYLGQTHLIVRDRVKAASGGILFIDEAYSLGVPSPFVQEAVSVLLGLVEGEYKGRVLVIMAGYEQDMEDMYSTNPGLAGRFKKKVLRFDQWTSDMGTEAFLKFARKEDWKLDGVNSDVTVMPRTAGAIIAPTTSTTAGGGAGGNSSSSSNASASISSTTTTTTTSAGVGATAAIPPIVHMIRDCVTRLMVHGDFASGRTIETFVKAAFTARCSRMYAAKAEQLAAAAAAAERGEVPVKEAVRGGISALAAAGKNGRNKGPAAEPIRQEDVVTACNSLLDGMSDSSTNGNRTTWERTPDGSLIARPHQKTNGGGGGGGGRDTARGGSGSGNISNGNNNNNNSNTGGSRPATQQQGEREKEIEHQKAKEVAAPIPSGSKDGADWWTQAMADYAKRIGPISAAKMLKLCQECSFDGPFYAFVANLLRISVDAALQKVKDEASRQTNALIRIQQEEVEATKTSAAIEANAKAQGIPCVSLWVCGFCGNSNPSCPYRATKSGGYYIVIPMAMANGPLCASGVADPDVKSGCGF